VIDEQFARQFFPGVDPVGRRIDHYGYRNVEIIGVARSVHQEQLLAAHKANVYYPFSQLVYPWAGIVVRSTLDAAAVAGMVAEAVRGVDPELPVYDVRTLEERVVRSLGDRSLAATVLGAFAGLALVLALLGTYVVLSYGASERTRELGIRIALGARPGEVTAMMVRCGATLAVVGLALGALVYAAVGRVLASMLYEVGPMDPLVLVGGIAALLGAALLASWVPARRAARVDPIVALRPE
jgi:putative ABC transport system permease protein